MDFPAGAFERNGCQVDAAPSARFECGVCWQVYDPALGDPSNEIPPGTPFSQLPDHWTCPGCEARRERFLLLADD